MVDTILQFGLFSGDIQERKFLPRLVLDERNNALRIAPLDEEEVLALEPLLIIDDLVDDDKGERQRLDRCETDEWDQLVLMLTTHRIVVLATRRPQRPRKGFFERVDKALDVVDYLTISPLLLVEDMVMNRITDGILRRSTSTRPGHTVTDIANALSGSYRFNVCAIDWAELAAILSRDMHNGTRRGQTLGLKVRVENPRGVETDHWLYCLLKRSDSLERLRPIIFNRCLKAKRVSFAGRTEALSSFDEADAEGLPAFKQRSDQVTYLGSYWVAYAPRLTSQQARLPSWCRSEPIRFLGFRTPGASGEDRLAPLLTSAGAPVLRAAEKVLWSGLAAVSVRHQNPVTEQWDDGWAVDHDAKLVVTNERVLFTFEHWEPYSDGTLWDLRQAARESGCPSGAIATGHMSWHWPYSVTWEGPGRPPRVLIIAQALGVDGPKYVQRRLGLLLQPKGVSDRDLGILIARSAAAYRLAHCDQHYNSDDTELDREKIRRQLSQLKAGEGIDPQWRTLNLIRALPLGVLSRNELRHRRDIVDTWSALPQ